VHTDTASSVTSDLDALRAAVDASGHPALFVVDAVASLGAAPLAMDAQRFDLVVGASQKGLMLPPGMGFVAVGPAALAAAKANPAPRFYWDWNRRIGKMAYQKFCGTPPLNLLMGLQAGLGLLFREGVDAVHARHRLLAGAVHAAVQAWSAKARWTSSAACRRRGRCRSPPCAPRPGIDPDALRTAGARTFPGQHLRRPGAAGRACVPHRPPGRPERAHDPGRAGRRGSGDAEPGHPLRARRRSARGGAHRAAVSAASVTSAGPR
jgi:alanine-glyoxylate transaminase/serine-glyoxylate transaminase/serine-pyruvate transaminase